MDIIWGSIVVSFGLFLSGFAVVMFLRSGWAEHFLNQFASSARAHFTEQFIRLVVGVALVMYSPAMWLSELFNVLGWLIVVTAIGLMALPWRWHHRFGRWAIPLAIRHLKLYGVAVLAFGALLIVAGLGPLLG